MLYSILEFYHSVGCVEWSETQRFDNFLRDTAR